MSAPAAAAPSGVVTFLFTDVEGSTRRWEADAEGMRVALAAHDEVLRRAIEEHSGWLFKHTGDGVCAAFASPRSAVDAAWHEQIDRNGPSRGPPGGPGWVLGGCRGARSVPYARSRLHRLPHRPVGLVAEILHVGDEKPPRQS